MNTEVKKVSYFPVEVPWSPKPGLEKLGSKDYGNGEYDKKVFQIEEDVDRYTLLKKEQNSKQPCSTSDLSGKIIKVAMEKISSLLVKEYSSCFEMNNNSFTSNIDGSVTSIDSNIVNLSFIIENMIQEDVVIFSGDDRMIFSHVCFPSGWDPSEKIGKSFAEIHMPVPGIEKINANASKHVKLMVNTPVTLVRYIWGMRAGRGLNSDDFVAKDDAFFMTERQCIIGLPEVNASIFTIRVRVEPLGDLSYEKIMVLKEVVNSMTQEELEYKGFNHPVIKDRFNEL